MFYNNNIMNILTKTKNDILKMKNIFNYTFKECSKNAIKRQNKVSFDKLFSFNVSKFCNFNVSKKRNNYSYIVLYILFRNNFI